MQLSLEIIRSTQADDPFAFAAGEQEYVLRTALGGAESATLCWDAELLAELAALRRPGRDPALAQRLGGRLRAALSTTRFAQSEAELIAAVARGEQVVVTLRLAAAELYALPWELLALSGSGLHLGALPGVLLRYAWPETQSAPPADDHESLRRDGGRILFAWSAAGGAVPVQEHLAAITSACAAAQLPFDEQTDVLPRVSLASLAQTLAASEQQPALAPTVLHILCHGAQRGSSFGLCWDDGEAGGSFTVDAAQLRQVLAPYARTLRLVVLMACDSANSGPLGNQLGSVAQALHRAGIASVVASRYPLSVAGSVLLADALYQALLAQPASLEAAVLAARARLLRESMSLDWAALQLFACPEDGDDTRPLSFRPYRGLSAFSPRHSRFFFGRQAERQQALSALRRLQSEGRPRFLLVTGASGTGKSSVVLAGLLPDLLGTAQRSERDDALARTAAELLRLLPAGGGAGFSPVLRSALVTLRQELTQVAAAGLGGAWEWAVIRPGAEPLGALDAALASRQDDSRPFLLIVDQLEELFTHGASAATASAFAKRLWALCQGESGLSCVVTLRVDFLGRCGEIALDEQGLWLDRIAYDEEHRVFVAQPGPDCLAEAIREPAERVGLVIAPSLVQRMVSEVSGEPGALPLLSHVLDQLWQSRRGRELSEEAYAALGGVAGALEGSAEGLYAGLSAAQQELARRLLLRLVGVTAVAGGETRLRVPLAPLQSELVAEAPEAEADLQAVLSGFVAARLLVWGEEAGQAVIEVAHEALIRRWSRLQEFLRADRARLLEVRELAQWQAQYETFGTLLAGPQLGYAERLWQKYAGELGAPIAALIRRSLRAKRRRWLGAASAIVAVLLALSSLSLVALRSAERAQKQRELARQGERTAQARLLSMQAEKKLESEPDTALLLSARAFQLRAESLTRGALLDALQGSATILRFLAVPTGPAGAGAAAPPRVQGVAFSRDSQQLVAAAGSAGLLIYSVSAGRLLAQHRPAGRGRLPLDINAVAVSPDGERAAASGLDGQVYLFSLRQPERPAQIIPTPARSLHSLDISPDGTQLAAGTGDGQVVLLDLRHADVPLFAQWSTGVNQTVSALAYEPGTGARLAVVGTSGALSLHTPESGARLLGPLPGRHGYLTSVAWRRGSKLLAASSEDGVVLQWDSQSGEPSGPDVIDRKEWLSAISYSPDGQLLAACGLQGRLTLSLTAGPPSPPLSFPAHRGGLLACSFAADGRLLAGGSDGQILLWDVAAHPEVQRRRTPVAVSALSLAGDGRQAVLGDSAGGLRLFQLAQSQPEPAVAVHSRAVRALAQTRDGRLLASGSSDGSVVFFALADGLGRPRFRYAGKLGAVTALALTPSGERLAVGYADGTLAWLDTTSGTPLWLGTAGAVGAATVAGFARAAQAVTALAFSTDGRVLWRGGFDGSLLSFDSASGQRLCTSGTDAASLPHRDAINSLVLRPSGDRLASAGDDGRILLWTPLSSGCLTPHGEPLLQERTRVISLSFSADGALLASGSDDHQVVIWDVERRQPLGRPLRAHHRPVVALGFGAARQLLSGDGELLWRWELDESAWPARACARAGRNLSLSEWQQAFGDRPYCRICAAAPPGLAAPSSAPECPP